MVYDMAQVALIAEIMNGINDGMGSLYYVKQDECAEYRVYLNSISDLSDAEIAQDEVVREEVLWLWKRILISLRDYDFERMRVHKESRVIIEEEFTRLFG